MRALSWPGWPASRGGAARPSPPGGPTVSAGRPPACRARRLPHDLGRCGMLGELSPAQLADAIAEALHAGIPGGARTDRTIDTRVLQQLGGALAGRGVTPQRLAAAVRAALGHAIPSGILSAGELELLAGDLFPAGYREQIGASLVRLDAVLAEVGAYASD